MIGLRAVFAVPAWELQDLWIFDTSLFFIDHVPEFGEFLIYVGF